MLYSTAYITQCSFFDIDICNIITMYYSYKCVFDITHCNAAFSDTSNSSWIEILLFRKNTYAILAIDICNS